MKPRGQSLASDNLQAVLDASPSSLNKGAQQFFTPSEYASAFALPLPNYRPVIADLNCGGGSLLRGAANPTTKQLLGFDIDPRFIIPTITGTTKVRGVGDVTRLFPLLMDTGTRFDLIVSNPPFSLKWTLAGYGDRPLDSTLATFRMLTDLLTPQGEAFMICNASTADKLLPDAPGAEKIWLWVTLPFFFKGCDPTLRAAVVYIRNDHDEGPIRKDFKTNFLQEIEPALRKFHVEQYFPLEGRNTLTKRGFMACCHELERAEAGKASAGNDYNIWLDSEGKISVYLTGFQELSDSVPKELAARLFSLRGRHPLELVVQVATRDALKEAVEGTIWRVHPAVVEAVIIALAEYNAVRAPFVPLSDVQRLGYLDEERFITCRNDLAGIFRTGLTYELHTRTVKAQKTEWRKRHNNTPEEVLVTGQCLVVDVLRKDDQPAESFTANPDFHDFPSRPLQSLVWHFGIPDVPDVAKADPERFEEHKKRLLALQR